MTEVYQPEQLVETVRAYFLSVVEKAPDSNRRAKYMPHHIEKVEGHARELQKMNPTADHAVVHISVLLHDIGAILGDPEADHAVNSEIEARRFLGGISGDKELIETVAHCVRAHRNGDVKPETLEAKILVTADSASHLTDGIYIELVLRDGTEKAKEKLERDVRDLGLFPEYEEKMRPLYEAWQNLLDVFPESSNSSRE
ncbi:HD domain-containing protein [Candidatus Dojkabacteria bacterium]|nr:HD domain-containing protein [Candidatus Dojkabacteria bacterium]